MNDNPYEYADEQIEYLRQEINAEIQNQQNLANFDELNVIKVKQDTTKLYQKLIMYHQMLCERTAAEAYDDALLLARQSGYDTEKKKPKKHEPARLVAALFVLYSAVTRYQYSSEAERKRERLAEGILSSTNRQAMREAYNTNARSWFNQARQYIDMSVDSATEAAYEDAGVEEVEWVTQKDERVCTECRERDGMRYKIGSVPDKPHPRCRCYIIPVSRA